MMKRRNGILNLNLNLTMTLTMTMTMTMTLILTLMTVGLCTPRLALAVEKSHPAVVGQEREGDSGSAEDFKGKLSDADAGIGFLGGAGIVHSSVGFAFVGMANKKIVHQGFAPEINNQVFAEIQAGPIFFKNTTVLFYSAHLRWDFQKDDTWTLFAIGGLAGHLDTDNGTDIPIFPRFGIGTRLSLNKTLAIRSELSHELIALGLAFRL